MTRSKAAARRGRHLRRPPHRPGWAVRFSAPMGVGVATVVAVVAVALVSTGGPPQGPRSADPGPGSDFPAIATSSPTSVPPADVHPGQARAMVAAQVQSRAGSPSTTACCTRSVPAGLAVAHDFTGPVPGSASPHAVGAATHWIVAEWAVRLLQQAGLPSSLVGALFDNPNTFLIDTNDSQIAAELPNATRVARYTSFAAIQQAFAAGTVPAADRAIMYDCEAWSFTPSNEQAQPVAFAARAQALAHQHNMRFIFTPAANLAAASGGGSKYQNFVAENLAGQSAPVSDVLELQAQQAEGTPDFLPFVTGVVKQARAANPAVVVLVGLSTNPVGHAVTSQDLLGALSSTRSMVDGYWLNIPQGGPQCPTCGAAQPQTAVALLQSVAYSSGA